MNTESLWGGIEGIVLDAVGTLIHPEPSVAEIYRAAAQRQGLFFDLQELKARFRAVFAEDEAHERLGSMETDQAGERERWRGIVGRVLTGLPDQDRAFRELWDHFGRADAWRCFPDVAPALAIVRKSGLRIVIGSNFDARLREVTAGLPELAQFGQALVISSEVGYRKPHGGFYKAACERLALPPAQVLCAGDDLENDVQGASRAGMRGVLIDRAGKTRDTCGRMADLTELVSALDRPMRS